MRWRVLIVCLLVLMVVPAAAQDDDGGGTPLHEMLALVPLVSDVTEFELSYIDYRAVERARPGAAQPESFAEWVALRNSDDESLGLWMAATSSISSGSGELTQSLFQFGAEWPEVVGFDFFDVDRELYFGRPPADATILMGEFDVDAIVDAFTARDFTAEDAGDFTLLCGSAGCDEGLATNLQTRNPANPFGGNIGREEPMLVSDSLILNSAGISVVEAMGAAASGDTSSLMDSSLYRAAANAIGEDELLIQAYLLPANLFLFDVGLLLGPSATAENQEAFLEQLSQDFEPMAQYDLVMFADTATETEQVVYVVLVYDDEEDAEIAAEVVPRRLENLQSIVMQRDFSELFAERNVSNIEGSVKIDEDTGKALTVITFRAPLASSEYDDDVLGGYMASSMVYRLLVNMVWQRDTMWLLTDLPELG